jgi:hypothetical protein
MSLSHSCPRAINEIQVRGELDQGWEAWFNGQAVTLAYAVWDTLKAPDLRTRDRLLPGMW